MYAFKFHRPTTVRQAAGLLAREEEAKLLSGGHTLIPTMKLRFTKMEGAGNDFVMLDATAARLDLSELREWTLEMNPATVSLEMNDGSVSGSSAWKS